MTEQFKTMNCYILAGGKNHQDDFSPLGDLTRLETGYRHYAKIFDKVKLVIKKDQAHEHYLNYPYVLDQNEKKHFSVGLEAALEDAKSDAVFIGSSDIFDFPLDWPVNLIKNYQGEPFLGYLVPDKEDENKKHLFGIYSKKALSDLAAISDQPETSIMQYLTDCGRFLPLPDSSDN